MVIMIDVDDVLCNLQETVVNMFNKRYDTKYKLDDFTEYNIMNVMPQQDALAMRNMYGETGLYDNVSLIHGAQDGVKKIINKGHEVYFVTAAVPKTYNEKVEFIKRYFPFIDQSHIVCMKHKWMFKCDVMIEDNLSTLLAKPFYHRVVMDMPWNRNVTDWAYDIHRCHNWNEIVAAVNKISELE